MPKMFWAIFKTLKQLLCAFVCGSDSFTDFDDYFKVLIHFFKTIVRKGLVLPITRSLFFLGLYWILLVFYPF